MYLAGRKKRKFGIFLGGLQQLFEPIRFGKGIGIEKGKPFSAREAGADVVGSGEAEVFFECDDSNLRIGIFLLNTISKVVRRAVIHENDLEVLDGLGAKAVQTARKMFGAVPGNNHN